MNKESIKRILQYTNEDSIPLATLGVIEGMIESYKDGRYFESYDCLQEIIFAMESFSELRVEHQKELNEPCLSDE